MRAKFLSLLKVYEDEISLLLWTTALLFIIRSSGIILNNYAETAFLKRYGVEYLPIVNMANAIATFFITGVLTAFMGKIPGAKLLSYLFVFCGLTVTGIRVLIPLGIDILYPILFMLKSQFELLQALLFWNLCNDLFNTRQSKRLFPLLTAGGVVGLILGSFGTPYFAKLFQLDNLLYLYLCTTLVGAVIVESMGHKYPTLIFPKKTDAEKKKKASMIQEFKDVLPLIKSSVLMKIVLVLTFMPNVVVPIMNYQFNYAINDQFASETSLLQFFGYFRGSLYIVSLFILLFVGRIYGKWGLPVALMFHPFNYMIAFFAFLFRFDMFAAMYARMSTNILRTTINVPANSILIGLFPESFRGMIRPFLRGTVVRIGLFIGSGLILLSEGLFHPRYLTLVALPFVLCWIAAPIILKSKYAKILMDLISKNMLDIKSLEQNELGQIFKEGNIVNELEQSFLEARGKDAIWYGKLLKNFSTESLDKNIIKTLENQDDETKVALIKMLSTEFMEKSIKGLIPALDPGKPEVTIAIMKILYKYGYDDVKDMDLTDYINHSHPVIKGFTLAYLYSQKPDEYLPIIDNLLASNDIKDRQAGIISAGLSQKREYIDKLLTILKEREIDPILPDIILALSRLRARELKHVIFAYLFYEQEDVRMAAFKALKITDDFSFNKAILLLGDHSDEIRDYAKKKIKESEYLNSKILIESLGLPNTRIRRGLFELLETLDIKDFDVFMFAKKSLNKCYTYLAMNQNLENLPESEMRNLVKEHMIQKKELELENIIRILAIHDQTDRMKTSWRGIFSLNTKQRANAIELLSDIMDKKLFNIMLPLLESPTTLVALAAGNKVTKIPKFDLAGKDVFSSLVSSEDWVDVLMGINLANDKPSFFEEHDKLSNLKNSINQNILKEIQMVLKNTDKTSKDPQRVESSEISLGEKILLLKKIDMFSDLSAAEMAAIASVTKEMDYPEIRTVIKQGSVGETVFLILDGEVEVIKENADGQTMFLDKIGSGDSFGEMALLENEPRSATIRTTKPSRFLILHKQEFNETVLEYPRIALKICKVLSSRIRHLHVKIQDK
jgi:HEAT repeat protein